MIAKDYIEQKFQSFGIRLSEAEVFELCLNAKIGMQCVINRLAVDRISIAIAHFIPSLLLRATSVSEGGFSMSWNKDGIKEYYSFLCKKYSIDNILDNKPKITFL